MDNFIQYLFYFIIIAAFLNSIFGKKRKVEPRQVSKDNEPKALGTDTFDTRINSSRTNEEDYTILNEIENLFKKDILTEPIHSEKKQDAIEFKKDYIEERAKEFEKQDIKRKDNYDWFSSNIRSKLKNPESLKDYIIISEILGKPKAFE
jgi:hypothetical protein